MKTKIANLRRLDILGNGDCSSHREILTAMLKQWRQKLGYCSIFAAIPAILASHVPEARSDEAKKPEASVAGRRARLLERLNMSCSNPALLKRQSEYLLPHQKGSFDLLAALAGNDDCPGRTIPGGNYTTAAPYIDSGDTTGANNTVTRARYFYYCYYSDSVPGSDHVYSFTLTGRGANPQIQVSRTSGTYEPVAYILDSRYSVGCPVGSANEPCSLSVLSRSSPSGTATIDSQQMNYLPLNVPLHLFVDSDRNDASGSGPYTIRIQNVTIAPASPTSNRKTGVYRPSTGELFLKNSNSSGFADTYIIFGNPGDYPIAGDWNGDGVDSVGIYRNGIFYLRNSNSNGFADIVVAFGDPSDQPVVGDWNGDGIDTIGVYRNGSFILRNSNTAGAPELSFTLGNPGDVAIAGDWNGDGLVSGGVFRPSTGTVYLKNSHTTGGFPDFSFAFGNPGDKPVAGDWNADGIDTIGIYRNGLFYLRNSNTTGFADIVFVLGNSGDFPIAGNWNG